MGKALDPARAITSLSRAPITREEPAGVTIEEIEAKVEELRPEWPEAARRRASLLFAILKQGCSIQKLEWFTKWDREYLLRNLEALRSRGLLFTGTLSTQYVLGEVPGSEDLIEGITGQKIAPNTTTQRAPAGYEWEKNLKASPIAPPAPRVAGYKRKEEPMNTAINGAAENVDVINGGTCSKSENCHKPDGHTGRCAGQGGSVRGRQSKKAEAPKASKPNARRAAVTPAKSYADARASKTATAAAIGGRFKIEYEDEDLTINVEGIGREAFASAVKVALGSLGGSNG